jgi:hypothetical protein
VTLRTRTLIASAVALVAIVLMGLILLAQYGLTAVASITVQNELSPAVRT